MNIALIRCGRCNGKLLKDMTEYYCLNCGWRKAFSDDYCIDDLSAIEYHVDNYARAQSGASDRRGSVTHWKKWEHEKSANAI